jgi:hypothetical protein
VLQPSLHQDPELHCQMARPPGPYIRMSVAVPAGSPPEIPPLTRRRRLYLAASVLAITAFIMVGAYLFRGRHGLLISLQMILLSTVLCLVPTLTHRFIKLRALRVLLESSLFIALFCAFGLWVFASSPLGAWVYYVSCLVVLLEVGGNLVERYKSVTLGRLTHRQAFDKLREVEHSIEAMFGRYLVFYASVPAGLIVGTIIGLVRGSTSGSTVIFSVILVLIIATVTLLCFLPYNLVRVCAPYLMRTKVPFPKSASKSVVLDVSLFAKDLRKIYLYNGAHDSVLLVTFCALIGTHWGFVISLKWLIVAMIGTMLLLNQVPYVIGQFFLHEKVLERFEGMERAKMAEDLKKYAPLFPTLDFVTAIFGTGTAGGLLLYLFDGLLKKIFA